MNLLEQLKEITTVVADTGDIESIRKYAPVDATTNPSLLFKAAQDAKYRHLVEDAVRFGLDASAATDRQLELTLDRLAINFGAEILKIIGLEQHRCPQACAQQVRAAQAGDREAFGELFRRYERTVFAIAMRRVAKHLEKRTRRGEVAFSEDHHDTAVAEVAHEGLEREQDAQLLFHFTSAFNSGQEIQFPEFAISLLYKKSPFVKMRSTHIKIVPSILIYI